MGLVMRRLSVLAALSLTAASYGCGGGLTLYPIEGVVLLDGAPLEGATVTFQPTGNGQPALGFTGPDGKFKAATSNGSGAVAGDYQVTLSKITGRPPDKMPPWVGRDAKPATPAERAAWEQEQKRARQEEREWVPQPYRTTATSPLRFTVPLKEDLVIELSSAPPKKG
jgi:hypothetical protein